MTSPERGVIELEREGSKYIGEWSVQGKMIYVTMVGNGSDVTDVDGYTNNPDGLATIILSQLVTKHLMRNSQPAE
jgi:hypothetical protein